MRSLSERTSHGDELGAGTVGVADGVDVGFDVGASVGDGEGNGSGTDVCVGCGARVAVEVASGSTTSTGSPVHPNSPGNRMKLRAKNSVPRVLLGSLVRISKLAVSKLPPAATTQVRFLFSIITQQPTTFLLPSSHKPPSNAIIIAVAPERLKRPGKMAQHTIITLLRRGVDMPKTMVEKIWDSHIVHEEPGQPAILYVDLHLVHEVTSPQAFDGLRMTGRHVRRPDLTVATVDHNVPTWDRALPITDEISLKQIQALVRNCEEFGLTLYDMNSPGQGIVHVIGPEQGYTQPGKTIVCGDSHTSTHGAFGALAMPIGTTQVEQVLATQCLVQGKPKTMEVRVNGSLPIGVTAKDLILGIIGQIGVGGGIGHVIEYTGEAVRSLSMEGRMTICNMSIEGGARAGLIAPDQTTFEYMRGRPQVPQGDAFEAAVEQWRSLATDPDATYDTLVEIEASALSPFVTWGTNPGMVVPITGRVPDPASLASPTERAAAERALEYMGLQPNTPMQDIYVDNVFIGSCTNSRIEDLRAAAAVVKGRKTHPKVQAMVVPGSTAVKIQAESEGLDRIFKDAGLDWREAGCSMCLGMNPDILQPQQRCASTSNRNFEGRQGPGGRTHLLSPQMAAAAAIAGHFVDIREWEVT